MFRYKVALVYFSFAMLSLSANESASNVNYLNNLNSIKSNSDTASLSTDKKEAENIVDIAGRERMLSQRIAKDYIYIGNKVALGSAKIELKSGLDEFGKNLNKIKVSVNDSEVKNMIDFVDMSFGDFKSAIKEPFNLDNAQIVLDLSESLLEGSQYIVDGLTKNSSKTAKSAKDKLIAKSGKQRMLSQRIAKYYMAYQSGIKDKNTVMQMKNAVKEFDDNLKFLMANHTNTPEINSKLNEVKRLWKIVHNFYLGIEKGGLPFIVFKSTNDITKEMDDITKLYDKL